MEWRTPRAIIPMVTRTAHHRAKYLAIVAPSAQLGQGGKLHLGMLVISYPTRNYKSRSNPANDIIFQLVRGCVLVCTMHTKLYRRSYITCGSGLETSYSDSEPEVRTVQGIPGHQIG